MTEAILQVRNLTKHFGGLAAVGNVSLEVRAGELHAVIGPNGAGKSTLINLLSGELAPSSGQIIFQGRDIGALPPEQRSRLGIGRSFQKTNIFPSFTALENCRLAAQSREPHPWRWLRRGSELPIGAVESSPSSSSGGFNRSRRRSRSHAQPRRTAPTRNRHVPGDGTSTVITRRTACRHGHGRVVENGPADQTTGRHSRRPAGGA